MNEPRGCAPANGTNDAQDASKRPPDAGKRGVNTAQPLKRSETSSRANTARASGLLSLVRTTALLSPEEAKRDGRKEDEYRPPCPNNGRAKSSLPLRTRLFGGLSAYSRPTRAKQGAGFVVPVAIGKTYAKH
ncbi:hypothetical protein MRX96_014897 [Rhipicephalus microplus]